MTATLEAPPHPMRMAVVTAVVECALCCRMGRVEWLPDGTVCVLHKTRGKIHTCVIQVPFARLPEFTSEVARALMLLR